MRKVGSLLVVLAAVLVMVACAQQPAQPVTVEKVVTQIVEVEKEVTQVVEVEVEKEVTQVVEVEKEVEVVVTATPVPGEQTLTLNLGPGDIPTIDPALATDVDSIEIINSTFIGATNIDEETSETEPGMATDWTVSEDGLTYTFNLREGIPWVRYNQATGEVEQVMDEEGNPRMVTCPDFEYGILRTLAPETAAGYAYILYPMVGAEEYNTADPTALTEEEMTALRDAVGVNCVDEHTLEMTITEPLGFWPAIAGMWIARAQPQWIIEEMGDRWIEPGFFQSYGPYALKDWNHEVDLTLIANPFWPGTDEIPQPQIPQITFLMLTETPAFAGYETGEIDAIGVPLTELDRVRADPALSQQLTIAPILCSLYVGFNTAKPPFDDPNVRKAFSWAVDRTALVENVLKGGQEPARWFARPGLAAAPDTETADFGPPVAADPEQAQAFLAESAYGSAEALPPIELAVTTSESSIKIAEAIQQMWQENLGVQVQMTTQEWNVFLETLDQDPPQSYFLGWCADYPHAVNFTGDVFRSDSGNNHTLWVNEEFDALVDQAAVTQDLAEAEELIAQAERLLVEEDAAVIPLYWATRVTLTKPYVSRTFSVSGGEAFYKWDILEDQLPQ